MESRFRLSAQTARKGRINAIPLGIDRAMIDQRTKAWRTGRFGLPGLLMLLCRCVGLKANDQLGVTDARVTDTRVTEVDVTDTDDGDAIIANADAKDAGITDGTAVDAAETQGLGSSLEDAGTDLSVDDRDACVSDCSNLATECVDARDPCDGDASLTSPSADGGEAETAPEAAFDDAGGVGAVCAPACTVENTTRCDGQDKVEICVNLGGCTKWFSLSPCPAASTCSNGTCVANPSVYENWEQLPGAAGDIGIGADGSVWIIDTRSVGNGDFSVEKWDGSGWDPVSSGGGVRIAVDPQGIPWILNSRGAIYRGSSNDVLAMDWGEALAGAGNDIAIGADGSVWLIGALDPNEAGSIYRWDGTGWEQANGAAVRIAVGPTGEPWVVNSSGRIYRLNSTNLATLWALVSDSARDIAINGSDVWIVSTSSVANDLGFSLKVWSGAYASTSDAGWQPASVGDAAVAPQWRAVEGAAVSIAVAPDGTPWIVNAMGQIYRMANH